MRNLPRAGRSRCWATPPRTAGLRTGSRTTWSRRWAPGAGPGRARHSPPRTAGSTRPPGASRELVDRGHAAPGGAAGRLRITVPDQSRAPTVGRYRGGFSGRQLRPRPGARISAQMMEARSGAALGRAPGLSSSATAYRNAPIAVVRQRCRLPRSRRSIEGAGQPRSVDSGLSVFELRSEKGALHTRGLRWLEAGDIGEGGRGCVRPLSHNRRAVLWLSSSEGPAAHLPPALALIAPPGPMSKSDLAIRSEVGTVCPRAPGEIDMRVMVMVKATNESEAGVMPTRGIADGDGPL